MFNAYPCLAPSYGAVIPLILLGTGCYISSAAATDYAVVAGYSHSEYHHSIPVNFGYFGTKNMAASVLPMSSLVGAFTIAQGTGVTQTNIVQIGCWNGSGNTDNFSSGGTSNTPLLGGFANQRFNCITAESDIVTVDGWTGVKLNTQNIIAGFTGSIYGGVVTIKDHGTGSTQTFNGGLLFDSRGKATAQGDVLQSSANKFCGGFRAPFGDVNFPTGNILAAPDNTGWGNKLASVDGYMWIYVPIDTPYGTYPLNSFMISQGPSQTLSSTMSITQAGDTIVVSPPACTISTRTDIIFNASSPATRIISAPITYQCSEVENQGSLDAYLMVSAISQTLTPTELALTIDGDKPGGIVRGYAGEGADQNIENCTDTANSLLFDNSMTAKLGVVANGVKSIPLIWQLCLQGNEIPGVANGSAVLEIGYK